MNQPGKSNSGQELTDAARTRAGIVALGGVVGELDATGQVRWIDAAVEPLLGMAAAELIGAPLTRLLGASAAAVLADLGTVPPAATRRTYRASMAAPNGTTRPVDFYLTPLAAGAGWSFMLWPRPAAEMSAGLGLADMAQTQRLVGLGTWSWDVASGELTWSPELYRLYGLDMAADAPNFATYMNFTHPEDRPRVQAALDAALQQDRPYTIEHRIRRADTGEERIIAGQGEVVRDAAGQPVRMLGAAQDVTASRRLQRELRQGRDYAFKLLDQLPVLIWRAGTDAHCDYFNTSWMEFTGRTLAQEQGDGWLEGVHPEDRARVMRVYLECFAARRPVELEYRLRHHAGGYRWILDMGRPFVDLTGEFAGYIGTCIDLTARKDAEEALRLNEQRYRAVVEDQTELICRWRPDGEITFVNGAFSRYFGQAAEALVGQSLATLEPGPSQGEAWREMQTDIRRLTPARPIATTEHEIDTGAETRWLQWTDRAIFDEMGALLEIQSVGRDITARKRMEQTLGESEERYRLVVDAVTDYAIFSLAPDGKVASWNPGAAKIKGYAAAEVMGQNFARFYPPEQAERPAQLLAQAAREGRVEDEGWRVRKDGSRFWANVVITALRDPDGSLRGFAKVVRDMSARKAAEDALTRQTEFIRLLQDVAVAANEAAAIEPAFQLALARMCAFAGWSVGHAYLTVNERGDELRSLDVWHLPTPPPAGLVQASAELRFRRGQGLPGRVLAAASPIWVADLTELPGFSRAAVVAETDLRQGVGLPILVGKRVVGVLEFFARGSEPPDADLMALMTHVGAQLGRVVERQQSEQALRRSEARFRSIFESAPIGIELVDLEGNLLACNPAISEILGYLPQDLRQAALLEPHHPANVVAAVPNFRQLMRDAADHNDVLRLERQFWRRDGHSIWGRLSLALVRDYQEQPQFFVAMLEDITTRKQMEAEVGELQQRLMDGREMERLHLAQELHDGPVQDLYGLTYQLKVFTNDLPPEVDAAPTVEVHRMLSEVVRTLRTICRELRPPTLAPFGLERAIRSHADVFMEEHPEYDVYLDLTPDGQQLTEAVRLAFFRIYQQALQNILRHAEARQVWVTFRLDEESIFLAVRDDGHGFAVPDRWLDLARQGRIGLVGAAERAQAVGGKLEIHSTPGKGTVVQVHAPRRAKTTLEYFGLGGS